MSDNRQINDFIEYIKNTKKSSRNTLMSYAQDLKSFIGYINDTDLSISDVTDTDINEYKDKLTSKGLSASSVSRAMSSIRGFYKYLLSIGEITEDPSRKVKNVKVEKKTIEVLTSNEIELLLAQPDKSTPKGLRDKAMLEVLYATGMKVSEIIALRINDYNNQLGFVICRGEDEQRHDRTIFLYPAAVRAVRDYLERSRSLLDIGEDDYLFLNANGTGMTRQGLWKILKSYSKSAHLNKSITPHTLRHSFAMHLLENGADIKDIQEILGHADKASTLVYADLIRGKIKDSYLKFHPRA